MIEKIQNYLLCRLKLKHSKLTEVPNVVKPNNKKTLGASAINSLLSLISPLLYTHEESYSQISLKALCAP